jgi:hypothetical protein
MPCENPNKQIIEDFIAAALAVLEDEGISVAFLLDALDAEATCTYRNDDDVVFTYLKSEYSLNNFYLMARSNFMQEYHVLPNGDSGSDSGSDSE